MSVNQKKMASKFTEQHILFYIPYFHNSVSETLHPILPISSKKSKFNPSEKNINTYGNLQKTKKACLSV